jgi:hypothetical protein
MTTFWVIALSSLAEVDQCFISAAMKTQNLTYFKMIFSFSSMSYSDKSGKYDGCSNTGIS